MLLGLAPATGPLAWFLLLLLLLANKCQTFLISLLLLMSTSKRYFKSALTCFRVVRLQIVMFPHIKCTSRGRINWLLVATTNKYRPSQQQDVGSEILRSDPAKWPYIITDNFRGICLEKGPLYFQNWAETFPSSKRNTKLRNAIYRHVFAQKAVNGGSMLATLVNVFGVQRLRLLFHVQTIFGSEQLECFHQALLFWLEKRRWKGLRTWNSVECQKCVAAWLACSNSSSTIDKELVKHFVTQIAYWTEVLSAA